jgi:hypothetical protein
MVCLTDAMVSGIVNNMAENLITSANAVLGFEIIKYSTSKTLLHKFLPMNK